MVEHPDRKQLRNLVERLVKQIFQLNSSIQENESRIVIFTRLVFLMKDVLTLEDILAVSFNRRNFFDIRRHLHFVHYYYERKNDEMMLHNAKDLISDIQILKPQIYQRFLKEESEKSKRAKRTLTINEVILEVTDKLRAIIREAPKNESEVQNAVEALFRIKDYDFEREKVSFEYSTKSYQPDFTFKSLSLAIDVKLCNSKRDEKEIIDQINADIVGYRTKYTNLLFLVYDTGFIRDTKKFSEGIEKRNLNVHVRVIKH